MIRVVTSAESSARDASAIAAGTPSRALMQRAGAAAAAEIALRFRDRLDDGVLILAGPGNNGGDAWVVARALAATGVRVRVLEPIEAKTTDAKAERASAVETIDHSSIITGSVPTDADHGEALVIDGLLGTGGQGTPRGLIADARGVAVRMRARGAAVVALDLVTGVAATTGDAVDEDLVADLSITFGTVKRGHLINRQTAGAIVVVDIGLGKHAELNDGAPHLVDERWAAEKVPRIEASAHKGIRKKIAIIGGGRGMAGASILAAEGALRSGVGMVKLVVAEESLPSIQEREPYSLAAVWPSDDAAVERDVAKWADAVIIGPGLGRDEASRALLDRVLRIWKGPTLLDADAITVFENDADRLAALLAGRPALLTPHPAEFARISGLSMDEVHAKRFDVAAPLAAKLGAAILVKGVPTIITSPSGERLVSATGTPALATAGSGDVLSGVAGTLLAQTGDPFIAGALGAFVHGRAAERVVTSGGTRGIVLEDVVKELRHVWDFSGAPSRYPVLAELPAIL
ncbi:MAG TPA: NAD(P)H-hydrate dehydratase [Gemmatimonadaceae bacterium]|jgi:NAD(P)H-hydrate epimerase